MMSFGNTISILGACVVFLLFLNDILLHLNDNVNILPEVERRRVSKECNIQEGYERE